MKARAVGASDGAGPTVSVRASSQRTGSAIVRRGLGVDLRGAGRRGGNRTAWRGRGWRGRGGRVAAALAAGDGVAAGLQATTKDAARSMPGNERAAGAAELGVYGRGLLINGADRTRVRGAVAGSAHGVDDADVSRPCCPRRRAPARRRAGHRSGRHGRGRSRVRSRGRSRAKPGRSRGRTPVRRGRRHRPRSRRSSRRPAWSLRR